MKKILGVLTILSVILMTSCKKRYTCKQIIIDTNAQSGVQSTFDTPIGTVYGKTGKWTKEQVEAYEDENSYIDEYYYTPSGETDSILQYTSEYITTCEKI